MEGKRKNAISLKKERDNGSEVFLKSKGRMLRSRSFRFLSKEWLKKKSR